MNRYEQVAGYIRERLASGSLTIGEKLPSVRELSKLMGFSSITVQHAYELLEAEGVCEARPRSGFYVTEGRRHQSGFPRNERRIAGEAHVVRSLPAALLNTWWGSGFEAFGAHYPSPDLFDRAELDRITRQVLRRGPKRISGFGMPQGDIQLRHEIMRRAAGRGVNCRFEDIFVGGTGMACFSLYLDAMAKPGDTVIVESPSYFPLLAGLKRRNLLAIELYSHPEKGIDPAQFESIVTTHRVRFAILMGSQHYPTGLKYSKEVMQKIVEIARRAEVVILENDMLGELNYDNSPSMTFKHFDRHDGVVQFGSFMCSLSPDYGIGWIIGGQYTEELMLHQYLNGLNSSNGLLQHAVAEYLSTKSQDRILRRRRGELASRMRRGIDLLGKYFPADCLVSNPAGGYMCWVRGPKKFDASALAAGALKHDISILPGPIFSVQGAFADSMALNFSFPWTRENEIRLATLGKLISEKI